MKTFQRFLRSLNSAGVDFVVVGGHAGMFHGNPRSTDDLDLLYRQSEDNAQRLARSVVPFVPATTADDFMGPADEFAIIRTGGVRIDLLPEISGVSTDEALDTAIEAMLFEEESTNRSNSPDSKRPKGGVNPTAVGGGDSALLKQALRLVRAFRESYRAAWNDYVEQKATIFPAGTYLMRRRHHAKCEELTAPWCAAALAPG